MMKEILSVCLATGMAAGAAAESLKIGWSMRDVSTDKPLNIPGQFHMRISKGVLDPVTLTALLLEDGKDLVCFLSLDAVAIRDGLYDEIRKKTERLIPGFPSEKILMNVTHTHAGPSHYRMTSPAGITEKDDPKPISNVPIPPEIKIASSDDYRDFLSTKAAEAITEAWKSRKPGAIAYGYGYATTGHSRRALYLDDTGLRPGVQKSSFTVNGHAIMYGNTKDKMFSGYEAGSDPAVNLLYTFDPDGKLTGALVNVPCPSQNSEGIDRLSASFWNEVRELIHKKYGDIYLLPQSSAAGDLAPRILHYKAAQKRRFNLKYGEQEKFSEEFQRKDIAEQIVHAFDEVLSWAKKDLRTEAAITHIVKKIDLSKRLVTQKEYEDQKAYLEELSKREFIKNGNPEECLTQNSRLVSQRNRAKSIVDRYESQKEHPKYPTEIHVLGIGDIAFASNQFELYMDFMHRIQARSPFVQTFVIQLAGVSGGNNGTYLATERARLNKGYGASVFCNQVSPEGGQELVEETLDILQEIRNEKNAIYQSLGQNIFLLDYAYECPPKDCLVLRSQGSGAINRVQLKLKTPEDIKNAVLFMEAQSCDKKEEPPAPIRITINGSPLYDGPGDFVKSGWSAREFPVPANLLKKEGVNDILIENLSKSKKLSHGFLLISAIKLDTKESVK